MARIKNLSLPSLSLLIFLLLVPEVTAITTSSVDFLLTLLRSRGHTLFANAISTSDLLFDLLRLRTLSLLAPPNPSLYTLDLTQTPPIYLSTLRLHVIPYLLSLSLPANATPPTTVIRTLLPSRDLYLTTSPDGASLLVSGVELLLPPVYYSTSLAVYRLRRSLSFPDLYRSVPYPSHAMPRDRTTALPPPGRTNHRDFPPINWRISPLAPENRTVFPPVSLTFSPWLALNRTVFSPFNWTLSPLGPPKHTVALKPVPDNLSDASPPSSAFDFGVSAPAANLLGAPTPAIVGEVNNSPASTGEGLKCGPRDTKDEHRRLVGDGHTINSDDYMLRHMADHDL